MPKTLPELEIALPLLLLAMFVSMSTEWTSCHGYTKNGTMEQWPFFTSLPDKLETRSFQPHLLDARNEVHFMPLMGTIIFVILLVLYLLHSIIPECKKKGFNIFI